LVEDATNEAVYDASSVEDDKINSTSPTPEPVIVPESRPFSISKSVPLPEVAAKTQTVISSDTKLMVSA